LRAAKRRGEDRRTTDHTAFEAPLAHPGEHLREDYLPA
jgi:hypothetical protein